MFIISLRQLRNKLRKCHSKIKTVNLEAILQITASLKDLLLTEELLPLTSLIHTFIKHSLYQENKVGDQAPVKRIRNLYLTLSWIALEFSLNSML